MWTSSRARVKGIFAHREPGGQLHAYVALARPADWFDAINFDDAKAAKVAVAAEFDGWSPAIAALIAESDESPILRPLHALPIGLRWPRRPGVTLVGDAAHLAPPAGEGANLAMRDGAELAAALLAHPGDAETALGAYELAMFPRAEATAEEAHRMLGLCLDERAPAGIVEFFTAATAREDDAARSPSRDG